MPGCSQSVIPLDFVCLTLIQSALYLSIFDMQASRDNLNGEKSGMRPPSKSASGMGRKGKRATTSDLMEDMIQDRRRTDSFGDKDAGNEQRSSNLGQSFERRMSKYRCSCLPLVKT